MFSFYSRLFCQCFSSSDLNPFSDKNCQIRPKVKPQSHISLAFLTLLRPLNAVIMSLSLLFFPAFPHRLKESPFLVACTRLYMLLCQSVPLSVRPSVGPSVTFSNLGCFWVFYGKISCFRSKEGRKEERKEGRKGGRKEGRKEGKKGGREGGRKEKKERRGKGSKEGIFICSCVCEVEHATVGL